MQIRAAVHSDVPRLLSLVRRYWEFEDLAGFEALRVELLLQRLLKERALGEIWVAESGDELCGYLIAVCVLSVEHRGLMAEIDEFFVVPQQRGTGVGAQLLQAAEASLAARGCVRLQLQLSVANVSARQFYERRGYRGRDGYQLLDKSLS
jgi:GNAT superfamily N-acetyltransferase